MRRSTCGCLSSFGIGLRQRRHASRGRQSGVKREAPRLVHTEESFVGTIALVPQVVDAVKLPVVVPVRGAEKNESVNLIQHTD